MNLITPSQLAKQIGVTRQATSLAIKKGTLPYTLQGKRKYIDLDDPGVQMYITENSRQREQAISKKKPLKNGATKPPKKTPSSNTGPKNSPKSRPTPKKKTDKPQIPDTPAELTELEQAELSIYDWNQRKKIAEVQLAEIKVQIHEKRFLPTDFITDALFRHIEMLHSNLERHAGIKIKEVCAQAIDDGEVGPKHIVKMVNDMLSIIHNTKKSIEKEIDRYEPKI